MSWNQYSHQRLDLNFVPFSITIALAPTKLVVGGVSNRWWLYLWEHLSPLVVANNCDQDTTCGGLVQKFKEDKNTQNKLD